MIAAATVVLLVAVVSVVIAVSRGGSPAADKPGPSPTSRAPNNGAGVPTTLSTGSPSPAIAWAHFASFSKLVGAKDGDTAHALKHGSCKVEGPASADVAGLLDQVECTLPTPGVQVFVARFDTARSVRTYLGKIITTQLFNTTPWATGGKTRGLEFTAPTGASYLDITSSICALPTYLVQFYLTDKTKLDRKALIADYWGAATFPDAVPPACNDSFTGASAEPPTTGAAPAKSAADIGESALAALLVLSDATLKAVPVATPGGFEIIVVGQQGKVFFWSWDNSRKVLSNVGSSTYPYDPKSVGPPKAAAKGTVLSGTVHATFIVTGVFSGDGSGNSVAYTTGHIGWGAIKALPSGNLAPAAGGVTFGGIGLEDEFAFVGGQLETADCSSTKPISECGGNNRVIKFWSWDHGLAQFVLSSTAGLPK